MRLEGGITSGRAAAGGGVPVSGLVRRFIVLVGRLEGWRVASKRLGALSRIKRDALGRGCGRGGRGALPLPRAAVISTGLRGRASTLCSSPPARSRRSVILSSRSPPGGSAPSPVQKESSCSLRCALRPPG